MSKSVRFLLVSGTALAAVVTANLVSAQPIPPRAPPGAVAAPPPPGVPAPGPALAAPPPPGSTFDVGQLPETRGTVQRFTLTPAGDLDGFVLADGTDVHVPPHLSRQLASAVRAGDAVTVRGYRSPSVRLVVATAVTDSATNQTIIDQGPPPPGFGPPPPPPPGLPAPGAQSTTLSGRIQTPLYGPMGDLNGAVLEDGTIVRVPPPTAYQFATLLAPGQRITVQGWGLSNSFGRVIEAQAIGPAVEPPPPPAADAPPAPPPQ